MAKSYVLREVDATGDKLATHQTAAGEEVTSVILTDDENNALVGQKAKANSVPVTLASDSRVPATIVDADGDSCMDGVNDALQVNVVAGSAGVAHTDDAVFTPEVDDMVPVGGIFNDVAPDALAEGDAGVVRMSSRREMYAQVRDAAGNERGLKVDADGAIEAKVEGGNTADVKVTLDSEQVDVGDRAARDLGKVDIAGIDAIGTVAGQKAKAGSLPVVIASDQNALPINDNAGSLTVDGTVSVEGGNVADVKVSLDSEVVAVDATGQGDVPVTLGGELVDISDRAARDLGKLDVAGIDAIGAVAGQKTKIGSLPVTLASDEDTLTVDGTVTADAGTGPWPVTDNAGSLTVDQATPDNLNANANLQKGDVDVSATNPVDVLVRDAAGDSCMDEANNALQVNVVAGSGAGVSHVDDAAFTVTSDDVVPAAGMYQSTPDLVDDGDAGVVRMTQRRAMLISQETPGGDSMVDEANDALQVNVVAGAAGGVAHTDDSAFTPGTSDVVPAGGVYQSTPDTVDDGDAGAMRMTQKRAQLVAVETPNGDSAMDDTNDALRVNVVAGSGSGVSHVDDTVFAVGSDEVVPAAGMFDDITPDPVDEGDAGVIRMSSRREMYAQIRDAAGNERGLNIDASGNIGVTDAGGALSVDGTVTADAGTGPWPVTDNAGSLTVDDGGVALAVDATGQGDVPVTLDGELVDISDRAARDLGKVDIADALPAGTNLIGDVVVNDIEDGAGDSVMDAVNDAIRVNIVAGAAGGVAHTDDAAFAVGSDDVVPAAGIFNDAGPDPVDEGDAGILRMSVRRELYTQIRDAAGNERGLNVDASGNITANVEGGNAADVKVTLDSEAVDVGDRAARDLGKVDVADIDGFASVQGQKAMAASFPVVMASDQSALSVDVSDNAARDLGKVDVASIDAIGGAAGQVAMASSLPVVVASDQSAIAVDATGSGDVPVTLGGELVDISDRAARDLGTVDIAAELPAGTQNIGDVDIASGPTGASALEVQGTAADNAAVVGDPVLMGGYHNSSVASGEEVGTGDAVRILCDSKGGVVRGQPPDAWSANGNYATAQTDASVKAAPGAGLSLYVTDIIFSTAAAMNFFLESATTTYVPAIYLAANGGWSGHFQTPIKWPANTAITITSSAAGNHSILINGYTAP